MDNNESIKLGNEWADVEVSKNGVITIRFKDPNKSPIVYDFSCSDEESDQSSQEKSEVKDRTEDSRRPSLEEQAMRAIWKGDHNTLRYLIDERGLSVNATIPETGRTLLQELCTTGSDEGFADCLRVLMYRGVDLRRRVTGTNGTNGTILHLLAEHGSLLKWDRVVNELSKPMMDELLCTTDNEGNTPLHSAAERGRMDIYSLVAGLCGPDSAQSEVENKYGNTPYDVLSVACVELNIAANARTAKAEDMEHSGKGSWYRNMACTDESRRIMLHHMMHYFNNLVHHRPLYTKEETELE